MAQQDPDVAGLEGLDDMLREEASIEKEGTTSTLLLDNTRSKIGRDFYEIFYRAFNEAAPPPPFWWRTPPAGQSKRYGKGGCGETPRIRAGSVSDHD